MELGSGLLAPMIKEEGCTVMEMKYLGIIRGMIDAVGNLLLSGKLDRCIT